MNCGFRVMYLRKQRINKTSGESNFNYKDNDW